MNYELAKKLKEAGFPQKGFFKWCSLGTRNEVFCKFCLTERNFGSYEILCDDPSLPELIEACGEEFEALAKCEDCWRTYARLPNNFICEGSTPEEAVANLWSALKREI